MEIVQRCGHRGLTLSTAESLTAGALASRIAEVPGASAALLGGVVAYSNQVKQRVLGVDPGLLESRGAVDGAVAAQMAHGAAQSCGTDIGIATTGVAGPERHQGKDVGTVYLGLACRYDVVQRLGLTAPGHCMQHEQEVDGEWLTVSLLLDLDGDRAAIREASVVAALELLEDFLFTEEPGLPDAH